MTTYYNIPHSPAEVQDGALRISKPVVRPKVTIIGYTDNTDLTLNEKYILEDINSALSFRNSDGSPNALSMAISEAFNAGAPTVEVVVAIAESSPTLGDYYDALTTTYSLIENTTIDYVVPAGVTLDSNPGTGVGGQTRSFAYQLANFCYNSTKNHQTAMGFIGVKGPEAALTGTAPTLSGVSAWVAALTGYTTVGTGDNYRNFSEYDGVTDANGDGYPDNYRFWASSSGEMPAGHGSASTDSLGNPIDIGAYLNVTAIPGKVTSDEGKAISGNHENGYYYSNGAAAYAGMFASTPINRGPSNLPISGLALSRELSLSQASQLTTARYVTMFSKSGNIRTSTGVTGAYNLNDYQRSDYTLASTVKAVHAAIDVTRAVSDRFLGEYNTVEKRQALQNEIEMALEDLAVLGMLESSSVHIVSTQTDQLLGQAKVDLKLGVPGEFRKIIIRVGLTLPGQST